MAVRLSSDGGEIAKRVSFILGTSVRAFQPRRKRALQLDTSRPLPAPALTATLGYELL